MYGIGQETLITNVTIMEEVWKDIKGYEGYYQVSTLGNVKSLSRKIKFYKNRVRSVTERILKSRPDIGGYLFIFLRKNNQSKIRKIHQLVAEEFLNHTPNGHELVVDHIDNNKLNNRVENLQLISQRDNVVKSRKKSKSIYTGVTKDKGSKKWRARVNVKYKKYNLGSFKCELSAAVAYNLKIKEL